MEINNWVSIILDSLYDGVLIADENAVVRYVNSAYTRITNVNADDIVGQKLISIRPGSLLPGVIKTGNKMLGVKRKVGDAEYVVNLVPIIEDGKIIGGISILNEFDDIYRLANELMRSNQMIKDLRDRVRRLGIAKYSFSDIVCVDPRSIETMTLARKISQKDMNVLITGESGTGKELYAQSIHNESTRRDYPFVAINCATLDDTLLETELFGYEEGSFTGAKKGGKRGLFEEANGGTLFLDEISEMDTRLQAKLLRALQENVIRPVGSVQEVPIDVRVIAATNKELEELIDSGRFRKDLFYRIAVFAMNVQPLRERRGDILPLIEKYLSTANQKYKKNIFITEETIKILLDYDWPGNVRELKNMIEYAAMMTDDDSITPDCLPKRMRVSMHNVSEEELIPLSKAVERAEFEQIKKSIKKYGDTLDGKKQAAKELGISLSSLYGKLKAMSE